MALSAGTQSLRASIRLTRCFLRRISTSKTQRIYLTTSTTGSGTRARPRDTLSCQTQTQTQICHQQKPFAFQHRSSNIQTGSGARLQDARTRKMLHQVNSQFPHSQPLCTNAIKFEDTEERALLEAVNTLPLEELYLYQYFTKSISAGIIKQRQTTGSISSTVDLLQVPGITNDRLKKLSYSINQNILKAVKQSSISGLGSSLHPRLRLTEMPACVVSIHIHLPHVSWIKMTQELLVEDWQTISLVDEKKKLKYDHALYQKKVWELCSLMPTADLYLLEEAPLRVNTTQIMPTMNRNYVEASLTTALTLRHCPPSTMTPESRSYEQLIRSPGGAMVDPEGKLSESDGLQGTEFRHVVYKLKPKAVSEHFSLLVGGERTSSLRLLSDIMNDRSLPAEGVWVEPEMWEELWNLPKILQEQRAQTLLVAATFYKLLQNGIM